MKTQALQHIAVIPDGNRRWATKQGTLAFEGHRYAVEKTLPALYKALIERKIPYCTFWALSPENFTKRSQKEIENLLTLMSLFFRSYIKSFKENNIKVLVIGDIASLPAKTQKIITTVVEETKHNFGLTFIFAINYGGKNEIVRAVKKYSASGFKSEELTEDQLSSFLDTHDIPDPDLIIRTGGEKRLSGFLSWQNSYAELLFVDTLFPDFSPEHLAAAIEEFHNRKRRFGK
ncbi:di-trans,poly-cis-decaprenylcistransferase [Candidatus Woesebacteria bacterium]|nr:di-trans,poly-cis-decaprenylcistransferase [Candidatus Woesebacteria bacterium]